MIPVAFILAGGVVAALLVGVGAKEGHPSVGTKPGQMPPWLLSEYQSAKANAAHNPQDLDRVAGLLRQNGFPAEADELVALAKTRAIADSPHTQTADKVVANAITEVAKVLAQVPPIAKPPTPPPAPTHAPAPVPVPSPAKPAPTVTTDHGTTYVLNSQQSLAKRLADHLNALVAARGGVARAKGNEDQGLVMAFQSNNGLKADGKWGPGAAAVMMSYWGDVPLVFYWPKYSQPTTEVPKIHATYENAAIEAEGRGTPYDTMRAKMLRLASKREQGQGYGTGTSISATGGMTDAEAAQLQREVAAAYFKTA